MKNVVMLVGIQGSGKSTRARELERKGYLRLNRDSTGGRLTDLVPTMLAALESGGDVVLDNTNMTIERRAVFLDAAHRVEGVRVTCEWFDTPFEDCQINVLNRMQSLFGKVLLDTEEIKSMSSPSVFPIGVLFSSRKMFQEPTINEGFSAVERVKFNRSPLVGYNNKALFLDYDGTLRRCKSGEFFPRSTDDVDVFNERAPKIAEYFNNGYVLVGVSNQSGIGTGKVDDDTVARCFEKTNELLGLDIDYNYCPHAPAPVSCYCRKPQPGLGVKLMHKYKLDLSQSLMIGDLQSDKTFAKRLGMEFSHVKEFFT